MAFLELPEGNQVPMHKHDDSWVIVVSGELEMTVGEQRFTAKKGDSWFTPKGIKHGGTAKQPTRLIEVFCERRFEETI